MFIFTTEQKFLCFRSSPGPPGLRSGGMVGTFFTGHVCKMATGYEHQHHVTIWVLGTLENDTKDQLGFRQKQQKSTMWAAIDIKLQFD